MRSKPPTPRFESWIDRQIREARERGELENLEGAGKPIDGLDGPHDDLWWAKKLMQRERLSLLPPALEIRTRVDQALAALAALESEEQVRDLVSRLNRDISKVNRTTTWGPPTSLAQLDAEQIFERWRRERR